MKTATAFLTFALLAGAASAQSLPVTQQSRPAPATGDARTVPPVKPTTGSSTPAPAPVPNDYKLSLGDKLRIEVYREPQLSQSVEVRPDGKITLPLVGDVPAAGYTSRELANTLTEQLREYVTTPVVTVIVAEALPPMFYVIGEVNAPGAQPLRTQISVLQALAVAGGFREFANTKKIRILRRGNAGTLETIPFNYKNAVSGKDQPIFLKPGDTIVVP